LAEEDFLMTGKPSYEELEQRVKEFVKESDENKQLRRALRESEDRLKYTFDQSPIGAAIVGPDYRFQRVNAEFCRFTGYPEKELLSLRFSEITHPDDSDADLIQMQRLEGNEIDHYQTEKRYIRKDGQVVWGRVSVRRIRDEGGGTRYHLPLIEDITERKRTEIELQESERKYRSLFDESLDAIYITSRGGRFLDANPALLELFGYARDELMGGIHVEQIYANPGDRDKFQKQIEKNGSVRSYEVKFRKKNGAEMDCLLTGTVRRSHEGSVLGYQGIIRDVTEQKRIERLRDDVHRMMRHDLKSPLIGITGLAGQLLKGDTLTDKQHKSASMIMELGERMLGFIDRTRDLFQMEAGNYKLRPQAVDIMAMFRRIENAFRPLALQKRTNFVFTLFGRPIDREPKYVILGEETLLEVMFANLIKNAIEASPHGGTIRISIDTLKRPEQDFHFIDIHNMGAVPANVRENFFEAYTTSGKKDGTGLGTHSAMLVARTHKGDISFTTSEEEGTHLIVHLPQNPASV
jgi:PAS domain S-box-containing protein